MTNGHEIGNHSLTHPCSGNFPFARKRALEDYTLYMMRHELDEASSIIERLLGVRPVSFAYPCGQKFVGRGRNVKSYVPLVAEEFLAGRGWMEFNSQSVICRRQMWKEKSRQWLLSLLKLGRAAKALQL